MYRSLSDVSSVGVAVSCSSLPGQLWPVVPHPARLTSLWQLPSSCIGCTADSCCVSSEQQQLFSGLHQPTAADESERSAAGASVPCTWSLESIFDGPSESGAAASSSAGQSVRKLKNNASARRSRDIRRAKEDGVAIRCAALEAENVRLRLQLAWLGHQLASVRYQLVSMGS